jgi:hypothetical protein
VHPVPPIREIDIAQLPQRQTHPLG